MELGHSFIELARFLRCDLLETFLEVAERCPLDVTAKEIDHLRHGLCDRVQRTKNTGDSLKRAGTKTMEARRQQLEIIRSSGNRFGYPLDCAANFGTDATALCCKLRE